MTVDQMPSNASTYVLGHADAEVQRLLLQARLYDPYTEQALRLAGLRSGMRVLDVGCGPGDVSFVAARLVGPEGTVLGIDAAADIIKLARTRAAEQGLESVRFEQTTVGDLALDQPVDAVIGRLILMHLPDPVGTLRQLAGLVRPGGFIAFSEFDMSGARSVPDLPLWRTARDTIIETFTAMGLDPTFAATLPTLFQRAGLGAPRMALGAPVGGADHAELMSFIVEALRSLLPAREKLGLSTGEFADPDALLPRLREEIAAGGGLATTPAIITAWSRV
ncbi:class I SAM-dependent methyltransferase [Mycobacterium sp.]|uniref:class I SAM-dependent methyltransferase n=1 Tax=Mycobacterium sp. TaxID=1785 RepID=UPI003C7637A2